MILGYILISSLAGAAERDRWYHCEGGGCHDSSSPAPVWKSRDTKSSRRVLFWLVFWHYSMRMPRITG